MAQWDQGYVTDVAYTTHFYREMTPCWLAMASLLLGHRPPDLTRPFAYADLGCGNGFTALAVAATCPHAEVWGFDFNPSHIEFATRLARQAGLGNAHFVETSFQELAAMGEAALPRFDMMVSHGVLSWISQANRQHLFGIIGQRLKPGGLAYLSYNVTTGWASLVPVRALMQRLAAASPERTDLAVPAVLDFVDRLKQAGATFFQAHPTLDSRLQDIRKQDPRYIAHEYLNLDWHPLMFADVAGDMAEVKCRFIGSATLAENMDAVSVPAAMAPILNETRDQTLRETLRDIGCSQGFRRDLYRKGVALMPAAEQQSILDEMSLVGLGHAVPESGPTFSTAMGTVTGLPEIYRPLIAMLDEAPRSLADLRASDTFASRTVAELIQATTLATGGNYAHPVLPAGGTAAGRDAARSLNRVISGINASGVDLPQLVSPMTGSAIGSDSLESMIVGQLLAGRPADIGPLTTDIVAILARSGRAVHRDGRLVTDPADVRGIAEAGVTACLERRVPLLRRLGILNP